MAEPTSSDAIPQNPDPAVDPAQKASNAPRRDPALQAREDLMAKIDAQVEAERAEEYKRFLSSTDVDPRAMALAAAMAKEAKGEALDVDRGHRDLTEMGGEQEAEPASLEDGAADVEPMAPVAKPPVKPAERISTKGEDPLGDYVVRKDGKPMFRTVVDGEERLIPLDRARQELQISLAAKTRFDQANELKRQLEAKLREASAPRPAAKPAAPAIDDFAVAQGLVRSLVSEPEDKAAAKMAEVFKSMRAAAAPAFDANALVRQARDEAVRTIAERDNQRALNAGLNQFTKDYPEIASDPDLFTLADKRTNDIAAEHSDWDPTQVMLEAGKQTREWMRKLGVTVKAPTQEAASQQRQQRKQGLVPMPQTRSARPAAVKAEEADESPQGIMAELRKSRGQPY